MGVAMPLQMIWTQIIGSKNIANYPELLQNSGGWIIRVMLDIGTDGTCGTPTIGWKKKIP